MASYIYLLESYNQFQTRYKIGFSKKKDLKERVRPMKTGNPDQLTILYQFETKHKRKVETAFHNLYSYKRIEGEWFELDQIDVQNFLANCAQLEENFDLLQASGNPYL